MPLCPSRLRVLPPAFLRLFLWSSVLLFQLIPIPFDDRLGLRTTYELHERFCRRVILSLGQQNRILLDWLVQITGDIPATSLPLTFGSPCAEPPSHDHSLLDPDSHCSKKVITVFVPSGRHLGQDGWIVEIGSLEPMRVSNVEIQVGTDFPFRAKLHVLSE